MDEGIRNVTLALQKAGLWESTLLVFSADNGGPINIAQGAGNNFPLRGGKHTAFEGGVRTVALVAGGWLPAALQGTVNTGYIHVADWWATFCSMIGVDPADRKNGAEGVPGVDSIDMLPSLLIRNGAKTPRLEIPLHIQNGSNCSVLPPPPGSNASSASSCALIVGDLKVVTGTQNLLGYWTGPEHPNGTYYDATDPGCPAGCLFNITADPTEHADLRRSHPDLFAKMAARLAALAQDVFDSSFVGNYTNCLDHVQYAARYKGFHGPACFE